MMHRYFIKTPWWVKKVFSNYIWSLPQSKKVYLTFDDGPHPTITPWVLDVLKKHHIKASFFCIGKNVVEHPHIYQRIIQEGHAVGNHTHNHLNGWKVGVSEYIKDVSTAAEVIESKLFRPPYGRIRKSQAKALEQTLGVKPQVIMWDVLSGDFDKNISQQECLANVIDNTREGSIIVFHDSEKAFSNLSYALPLVVDQLLEKGFMLDKLN